MSALNVLAGYYSVLCIDRPCDIDGCFVCCVDEETHNKVVARLGPVGWEPLDLTKGPNGPFVDAAEWLDNWVLSDASDPGWHGQNQGGK